MSKPTLLTALSLSLLVGSVGQAAAQATSLSSPTFDSRPAPPATAPASPGAVPVRVAAGPEGVLVHHASGGLCRGQCELMLEPGLHQFGVSRGDGNILNGPAVVIDRPGVLRAEYVRRSGTRATGWAIFGVGMPLAILGAVGGTAGVLSNDLGGAILGLSSFIAGSVNLILALAVGLPLGLVGDSARITFD